MVGEQKAREYFREKIELTLACDEHSNRFLLPSDNIIAPMCCKRVESALKLGNIKEICTVMLTILLESSRIIVPTISFTSDHVYFVIHIIC